MKIWTDLSSFCHNPRVWQTNGQTDRILIARRRLHSCSAVKNRYDVIPPPIVAIVQSKRNLTDWCKIIRWWLYRASQKKQSLQCLLIFQAQYIPGYIGATHGIAKAFLSVHPSVYQTHVTKRTKLIPYSYTIWKNVYTSFATEND